MNSFVFFLYKIAGGMLTPPGCFFVLLFLLPLVGAYKTGERTAKRIYVRLFFIAALMYALFMPVTAEFLMSRIETERPALPDDDIPTVVAVLAGGGTHPVPGGSDLDLELSEQSYHRLVEGVRAANERGWPLIYSGSYEEGDEAAYAASIRSQAARFGFRGDVTVETSSRNTWENLRQIAKIAEQNEYGRVVLSTTAYHMKRALWMAERHMSGIEIVPWPSGWHSTRDRLTVSSFGPSARAFYDSCTALRELIGLVAYRMFF